MRSGNRLNVTNVPLRLHSKMDYTATGKWYMKINVRLHVLIAR